MTDDNQHIDPAEASEAGDDGEGQLWWGLPVLFWSLVISLTLHGLGAAPFLIWEFAPNGQSFETEWLEQFEDLEGIGHGMSQGRWAKVDDMPRQAPEEEADEKPAPEPKDKPEPEPKEKPEEKPEPKPEDKPEPKPDEKPQPKPEDKPEPDQKPSTATAEATEVATGPFRADEPLPGLEREGPSNIPNLKHYGPGNARMTALVRMDRIRGSLYEEPVRKIMQAVPDFRILAHSTGFDPIDDIDSFFMASPRPQYIQYTFLAIRHQKTQAEIKAVLDRRFKDPVPWQKKNGYAMRRLVPQNPHYSDKRKVMLARPGLTVVGRDKWLTRLAENLPKDSPLRAKASEGDKPAKATLLDGLAQIERAAAGQNTIVVMSAQGLAYDIPGLGRMVFEGVRLSVTNPASPTLDVDLKFKNSQQAAKFANACPALRSRLKKAMGLDGGFASLATSAMGLGDIVDKLKCKADKDYVNIHAVYTAQQVRTLAGFAAPFMPRPKALDELPPPPPKEPVEQEESGPQDAGVLPDASGSQNADE